MSEQQRLSYDKSLTSVVRCDTGIAELEQQFTDYGVSEGGLEGSLQAAQAKGIARLKAGIAELEARSNQNLRNSSKPHTSDSPFVKLAPKSLRTKGIRRPRRPVGRDGVTLEQVTNPNAVVGHEPQASSSYGPGLAGPPEAITDALRGIPTMPAAH